MHSLYDFDTFNVPLVILSSETQRVRQGTNAGTLPLFPVLFFRYPSWLFTQPTRAAPQMSRKVCPALGP